MRRILLEYGIPVESQIQSDIHTFTFTDEDYERVLEVSVGGEHYYGERP